MPQDKTVYILNNNLDVLSFIKTVVKSGEKDDAFHVFQLQNIVNKHENWKRKLPRVEAHYAIKCNDHWPVLKILAGLGSCFDCASKGEIEKAVSLGVPPKRIIFANPTKMTNHIQYAKEVGVEQMTFDTECELERVKELYPNAKMVLRIRCDAKEVVRNLGIKFGCDPITEAPKILQTAKRLNIQVVGVSFHVGCICKEIEVYKRAIKAARHVFDCAEQIGIKLNLLDLGGGYPGYQDDDAIDIFAAVINKALDDFFPDPTIRIIAEPGRFFVTDAYTLVCKIHNVRPSILNGKTHYMYSMNDGIHGTINCDTDSGQLIPELLQPPKSTRTYSSSLWGPTCNTCDQIANDISLPKLEVGDWVYFKDMGAYTLAKATCFNGFYIPNVIMIAHENNWPCLKKLLPEYKGVKFIAVSEEK